MIDLREKVREDRGLLKKIELAIPGFRGYRKREDLRIADSLLRAQLADRIKSVGRDLEECRESLTRKMELDLLEETGNLVSRITSIEGKVRHAEQGYTGISADYRIEEEELNRLYEWDIGLINHIDDMRNSVSMLQNAINSDNKHAVKQEISNISKKLRDFIEIFEKRREAIIGLGV
ncbi:MAG: hypothetical protein QXS02_00620 [Candidatus Thermoplasmatota archaeon]